MQILTIAAFCLGTLQVTSYRAVPSQTDSSPTWTSIGDRTTKFGCAVSQDLLKSGAIHYGDTLYVEGYGYRVVNDCMNPRIKRAIDLFVQTEAEERAVGVRKLKVYLIKKPTRGHYERQKKSLGQKPESARGKFENNLWGFLGYGADGSIR